MLNLTLKGRIPSKKNSRNIVCKGNRRLSLPSAQYKQWHEDASWQLKEQKIKPLDGSGYNICVIFHLPDNRKTDLSNKFESVADLLVDNGILEDDNCNFLSDIRLKYAGVDRENPRAEIFISYGNKKTETTTNNNNG